MQNDILFKTDETVFSYRVAGILIKNGKILLQKPDDDDGYSFIGGHVAFGETTEETLKREFKEEIGADIEPLKLFAIGEIFFPWGKRVCHQISLYYKIILSDETQIPMTGNFFGYDEMGNKRYKLGFYWIPINELNNITVYPKEIMPSITSETVEVLHFVSKQINEIGN